MSKGGNNMRCLLVDDEPHAIELLKNFIRSVPSLQIVATCHHGMAAFEYLQANPVDLIFLDIQMPGLTGIDLLKSIPHPPKVIFTTAYRDYALDGYELGVVDYLLKPISFDRFLKAVYKVTLNGPGEQTEKHTQTAERFLYFRSDRKMIKVVLNEILYVESLKDYIRIVTVRGEIITRQSISSVGEMLPGDTFVRIHRSFIIALNKIESYTTTDIAIGKTALPIGPLYRHEIERRLQHYSN